MIVTCGKWWRSERRTRTPKSCAGARRGDSRASMATACSRDPLRSEAAPLLKARGAASSLEGLVRLLARQAAREAIASGLDKARSEMNPAAVELSAGKYLRQHWGMLDFLLVEGGLRCDAPRSL